MSSTEVATTPQPSRQAIQAKTASKPRRVTGKLKTAIDLMVFGDEAATVYAWDEAARQAGLTVRTMRLALERQHVRRYLKDQQEVFRAAICAANPRRLAQIRDQDDNRSAAVKAIQVLEQRDTDPATASARTHMPGVVIVIGQPPAHMEHMRGIEPKPLIEQEVGSHVDQGEAD